VVVRAAGLVNGHSCAATQRPQPITIHAATPETMTNLESCFWW